MKLTGLSILIAGMAHLAFGGSVLAPEIDANSAYAAITLVSGGLLVLRARRKN